MITMQPVFKTNVLRSLCCTQILNRVLMWTRFTWDSGGNKQLSGSVAKSRNILWLPGPELILDASSLGFPQLLSHSCLSSPWLIHLGIDIQDQSEIKRKQCMKISAIIIAHPDINVLIYYYFFTFLSKLLWRIKECIKDPSRHTCWLWRNSNIET